MKRLPNYLLMMLTAVLLATFITSCSESGSDSDPSTTPIQPQTPVADGDWQVVPATGGTIEKGDITIIFPNGTFNENAKVAVTEMKENVVSEDARSKSYQVTVDEMGTLKPFTVKLKCKGATKNVRPIVKTIAWDKHSGKTDFVTFDIEGTVSGDEIIATIPLLSSDGVEKPYFSIGLAECPPDDDNVAQTRAETLKYVYMVGVTVSEYNKNRNKYSEIRELILKTIPEISDQLKSLGFNAKSPVFYRLVSPEDNPSVSGCWGVLRPNWFMKDLSRVSLNSEYFLDYITNKDPEKLDQLKATLIHETLHSITTKDYDPRTGWSICKAGEKGDDWAQFDEGLGCWVEKAVGKKQLSENTVKWQNCFIQEFYPHERNQETCKNCGYGMGTFIEYMARKTSDKSIVTIFEAFKNGNSDFRSVLKNFLSSNNIQFFDTKNYYDFVFSVMNNDIDPQIDIDATVTAEETVKPERKGKNENIMEGKDFSFSHVVYNYGALVHRLYYTASFLKQYKDSTISITQNNENVLTRIYCKKNNHIELIGQCMKGDTISITPKELSNMYKVDLSPDIPTGLSRLYFVTTRIENKNDNSSLPSNITIKIKEQLVSASVSPTELTFPAEGGTQSVKVTAQGFTRYNHKISDKYKEWLSAKNNPAGKMDITVQPNTTGKERIGYVRVYVFNDENPTEAQKVYLKDSIKVTQAANKEPEQQESAYELVGGGVNMYYAVEWRSEIEFKDGDDRVTITPSGKGAKVQIQQSGEDTGRNAEWEYTLSFDVDDLSLYDSKQAKISNFKYEFYKEGKGYDYYGNHVDWEKSETLMTSNAPMQQTAYGNWRFESQDLSYYGLSITHFDKYRTDPYSSYTEHTDKSETKEMTPGSNVTIWLTIKKK